MPIENQVSEQSLGRLIVFEGSDGVGKTTVAERVSENLRKRGADVLLLSFPGREPNSLGKLVYEVHQNAQSLGIDRVSPTSLQTLHIAAHIDCIEERILPALANKKTVILDRYWWSTVAYGIASGIPRNVLDAMVTLEKTAWNNIKPDKLFLITRHEPFRVELSNRRWSKVCSAYENLTKEENGDYPVDIIENSKPLKEIVDSIVALIRNGTPRKIETIRFRQKNLDLPNLKLDTAKPLKKDHWAPTKPTEIFDTYWRFAAKREAIFFKRFRAEKAPWTKDHILQRYKFTNAYRASDRVSQYLIRHVIYEGEQHPNEIFFRTILFKTFNKIETWKLLLDNLGQISWREYDFRAYDRILTSAKDAKTSIYSGAYIMPSGGRSFGHKTKHRNHLKLLQKMMDDELPSRIGDAKSMQEVFELLRSYPMIGDFLAYQYATDINYSTLTDFSEMSFVVPGPGARDGLQKCFSDPGGLSEVDLIKLMADRQEDEFSRLGIEFQDLWGRRLQLIDCQNLFCEVDKYARIAHPEARGISGRSRIKQKFRITPEAIEFFYPPKWNINEDVIKATKEG